MTERHLSDNQISEYALGLMGADARSSVEEHLGGCGACAEHVRAVEHALSLATPPDTPAASDERVEASWQVVVGHIGASVQDPSSASDMAGATQPAADITQPAGGITPPAGDITQPERGERTGSLRSRWADWLRPAFGGMPQWSWQMAQVVILAGVGFAAAWYLAGQGWLPGTQPAPELQQGGQSPSIESTREWLAANGYAEQLEVLLLDLARGQESTGDALTPMVKEVSRNLLTDARWYRRAADRAGDPLLADLLSEIEIVLLAVATVPEGQEDDLVTILRDLIDEQDLLWRLRSVRPGDASSPERDQATFGSSG
jgi:hypothetical protein